MVSLHLYFLDAHYYHDDYRVHLARVLSSAPPVSFWFRVLLLIFNDETTQLPYFSLSDFIYPQANGLNSRLCRSLINANLP